MSDNAKDIWADPDDALGLRKTQPSGFDVQHVGADPSAIFPMDATSSGFYPL